MQAEPQERRDIMATDSDGYREQKSSASFEETVGRLIAAQLYQVSPYNPLLLSATAALLAIAALLACLIPARRATLVNPIQALRAE